MLIPFCGCYRNIYYLKPITYASRLVEIKMGKIKKIILDKMKNLWYNVRVVEIDMGVCRRLNETGLAQTQLH